MSDEKKPVFDTPFDRKTTIPPYNEVWAERREVNKKLKHLAYQMVTKEGSEEKLQRLGSLLDEALTILENDKDLLGRKGWVNDKADHGSYREISREITPLSGNSNVYAPPMHVWFDRENKTAHAKVTLNWLYEGPPECVHGGIVAALFDEFLGCAQLLSGKAGATGSLTLHYHRPTPLNAELRLQGEVKEQKGRKLIMSGEMYANDKLCVTAEGLFVVLEQGVMNLADTVKDR